MQIQTKEGRKESSDLHVREKQPVREAGTHEGPWFEPRVDIYETAEALVVRAEVPGVGPEDIETNLEDSLLTITGRYRADGRQWKALYREYVPGHFTRQFRVGQQIDQAKIAAELKDGVLTVTMPKAEHARPRKIQVQTA